MKRKKILIIILCLIILTGGGIVAYASNQKHKYNNYLTQAKELINKGEYSNAENILSKAKSIDNTDEVSSLLNEVKSLQTKKEFDNYINQTKELIKAHKYTDAKKIL